jgi:hypothetical protein
LKLHPFEEALQKNKLITIILSKVCLAKKIRINGQKDRPISVNDIAESALVMIGKLSS